MLIIAHRGASGHFPENTLLSFEEAIKTGAKAIELDVHVCKSGELVVIHDETIDRTTNGKGKVSEITLTELQALNAGNGEKIPTLQEVFDLIQGKAQINIELKGKKTAEQVAKLIKQNTTENIWHPKDFFISSFHHKELYRFHEILPEIHIGILYNNRPYGYKNKALMLNAFSINMSSQWCTTRRVKRIHQNGQQVWAYTVNNKQIFKQLVEAGVDAIFTNFPELFIESRKK